MHQQKIHPEMMLPEIIRRYPITRKIFDRYGLLGCGGPLGPNESLAFFARAHRVPEPLLVGEIEDAIQSDASDVAIDYRPGPGDLIYRGFFKAAILTMFTFGCVLGGINLAILAARQELASLDLRAIIWAHAHAQIAGWVTLFVMGFAYQAFPRFKLTTLWRPKLAAGTLYAMASALVVRTLADLWQFNPIGRAAGSIAGLVELVVVITFAWIIARSLRSSRQAIEPHEKFIYAALGWMIIAFSFDLWIFAASSKVGGYREWVRFIGLYDAPWRDLQLVGFAGTMILGVSQRFLPFIYGFREVSPSVSRVVFWLWNGSAAGGIASYWMLVRTRGALWAAALELSVLGLMGSLLILVRAFGLYSVKLESDRSLPFIRAAWGWGIGGLALLALAPLYHAFMGVRFSHAYFGAYRHAFTVGFISLMIVGVSSKVVPVLAGVGSHGITSLRASFWLINIGNSMRVIFQILTDSYSWAFPIMAASAWVEVSGLAWWAIDLWRTMNRHPGAPESVAASIQIAPLTRVFDVITRHPETEPVFLAFGFHLIRNPAARRVFARAVTLDQACRLRRVEYARFAAALEEAIGDRARDNQVNFVRIAPTEPYSVS